MSHTENLAQPAPEMVDRLLGLADGLISGGRPADALPALARLRALPQPPLRGIRMQAEALLHLGRLHEAGDAADAALERAPGTAELLRLRARIHLARGAHAAAVVDAADAVMAAPDADEGKTLLGLSLLAVDRGDEAVFLLGEVMQAHPEEAAPKQNLARAFMLTGHYDAAEELLAICAAAPRPLPQVWAMRAQNALLAGQPEQALALAQQALATGSAEAALHAAAGHALVKLGRQQEAGPHFIAASRLAPQDQYLAHLAAAAGNGQADRASNNYVAAVFDDYADRFEASLIGLGYRVPGLIRRAAEALIPGVAEGRAVIGPVLDLGCGTGLAGVALYDVIAGGLTGVDLSGRMLAEAAAKRIYTRLEQQEIGAFLAADAAQYALVLAADVFCYFGALEPVLEQVRSHLQAGGLLIFSLERGEPGTGWTLYQNARYRHAADYVQAALAAAGLQAVVMREEDLRREGDGVVAGLFVVARAHGH